MAASPLLQGLLPPRRRELPVEQLPKPFSVYLKVGLKLRPGGGSTGGLGLPALLQADVPVAEALKLALESRPLPPECCLGGRSRLFYCPPDPDQHTGERNRILLWGPCKSRLPETTSSSSSAAGWELGVAASGTDTGLSGTEVLVVATSAAAVFAVAKPVSARLPPELEPQAPPRMASPHPRFPLPPPLPPLPPRHRSPRPPLEPPRSRSGLTNQQRLARQPTVGNQAWHRSWHLMKQGRRKSCLGERP